MEKFERQLELQINLATNQRSIYSELVILSSDEDERMSDGVSVTSTDTEE